MAVRAHVPRADRSLFKTGSPGHSRLSKTSPAWHTAAHAAVLFPPTLLPRECISFPPISDVTIHVKWLGVVVLVEYDHKNWVRGQLTTGSGKTHHPSACMHKNPTQFQYQLYTGDHTMHPKGNKLQEIWSVIQKLHKNERRQDRVTDMLHTSMYLQRYVNVRTYVACLCPNLVFTFLYAILYTSNFIIICKLGINITLG